MKNLWQPFYFIFFVFQSHKFKTDLKRQVLFRLTTIFNERLRNLLVLGECINARLCWRQTFEKGSCSTVVFLRFVTKKTVWNSWQGSTLIQNYSFIMKKLIHTHTNTWILIFIANVHMPEMGLKTQFSSFLGEGDCMASIFQKPTMNIADIPLPQGQQLRWIKSLYLPW